MIGLGNAKAGSAVPVGSTTRWVLNTDPAQVMGVAYTWIDASTWDDTQIFKD